jgi:hypothetical protein
MCRLVINILLVLCSFMSFVVCEDVTDSVFGPILDAVPAAYGGNRMKFYALSKLKLFSSQTSIPTN